MAKIGKRTKAALEGIDRDKIYELAEAVKLVKERAKAKFDETVEIAMNLGVDPRHADQMVRGVVNLPNGTGKNVRVAVFAKDAKADEARKAGADIVGAEDLVAEVQAGNINFDRVIATPDMMPLVGRLGKILGPRNLMPNPKVGTVTPDVAGAVKAAKGGAVEFRVEKAGILHAGVGKASFTEEALVAEHQGVHRRGAEGQARGRQGHLRQARVGELDHGPRRARRSRLRSTRTEAYEFPAASSRRLRRQTMPVKSCPRLRGVPRALNTQARNRRGEDRISPQGAFGSNQASCRQGRIRPAGAG